MSGIILTSFWRHLNNAPINLDEQIHHYRQYWARVAFNDFYECPTDHSKVFVRYSFSGKTAEGLDAPIKVGRCAHGHLWAAQYGRGIFTPPADIAERVHAAEGKQRRP